MYKQKVVLGVAPTKRSFLSMEEAKRQKDKFMARIRAIKPEAVGNIDVDELCRKRNHVGYSQDSCSCGKIPPGRHRCRFFFHSAILVKNR